MKSIITLACAVLWTAALHASSALAPAVPEPALRHLSEVNKQWLKHEADAPADHMSFATDVDRIRYHLLKVEHYLRSHTPAGLTEQGLLARPRLLDALHLYANASM